MKKMSTFFTSLLLACSFESVCLQNTQTALLPETLHVISTDPELSQIYTTCSTQTAQLDHGLCEYISCLSDHLFYWKIQEKKPWSYLFKKGPIKWFVGKPQSREIADHISALTDEITYAYKTLGTLVEQAYALKQCKSQNEAKTSLTSLGITINSFLCKTCLTPPAVNPEILTLKELFEINRNMFAQKKQFRILQNHQKPPHITRHWLAYSTATIANLGMLIYWLKNKSKVQDWLQKTSASIKYLFVEKGYKPINNVLQLMYGQHDESKLISHEKIKTHEAYLEKLIHDYLKANHPEISKEIQEEMINNAIENRTMPHILLNEMAEKSRKFKTNLYGGNLGNIFNIYVNMIILMSLDRVLLFDEFINKKFNLNIELLVAIPSAAVSLFAGYSLYKVSKNIYSRLMLPDFKQLITHLARAEHLLIAYDNKAQQQTPAVKGELYYCLSSVLKKIQGANHIMYDSLIADLRDLISFDLMPEQKHKILKKIYRLYPFLAQPA